MIGKNVISLIVISLVTALFFIRVINFAASFGGVEHDSGWFLGVAKNVASKGIYASYTNTVIGEGNGSFDNIFKRYSLQDENGFVYFPAAVTVGPGYIYPEALILKLFGNGWWQYRAWPLVSFAGLIILSLSFVYLLGGYLALGIFAIWLWILPQFTTQFAYEAFSEQTALFYFFGALFLLYATKERTNNARNYLFAGICIALSLLTKTLFLLPALGSLIYLAFDIFEKKSEKRILISKWLFFFLGILIPLASFYLYEYTFIVQHFGQQGIQTVLDDNRLLFLNAGSGFNGFTAMINTNPIMINAKLNVWTDVGINLSIIMWLTLFLSPILFIKRVANSKLKLLLALYVATLFSFIWFLCISTSAWGRYIWQGLFMGMMLVSIVISLGYKLLNWKSPFTIMTFALSITLIVLYFNYSILSISPILNDSTIPYWAKIRTQRGVGMNGFPSNNMLSLSDQKQVVSYFTSSLKKHDRVYYIAGYLNAEIAALTDTVFFPLNRYVNSNQKLPNNGKSYVIIGPYQQGYWSLESPHYPELVKKELCKKVVLQNPSYLLCELRQIKPKTIK